jgi:uncharacterized membrane protein
MKNHVLAIVTWLAILAAIVLIALIILYAWRNDSGHTGAEPYHSLFVFIPVALLGFFGLISKRLRVSINTSLCALLIGIAGSGLIVYLDKTNQLVEYGRWVERGMPAPNTR